MSAGFERDLMPNVTIHANQRVAFIGKTNSGKTFLARHLLQPIKRLIVLDGKGTLGGSEWNLEMGGTVERQLRAGKPARLRVVAPTNGDWTHWLRLAWDARNVTVYIDEMMTVVAPRQREPNELTALYTRGRELGIGVWASTQRPVWVPPFMLSEAEWIFLFRVSKPDDRKAVADFGDEYGMMRNPIRDEHGFWTYNVQWRRPIYTKRFAPPKRQTETVAVGERKVS